MWLHCWATGRPSGLLGNANGDKEDDLQTPDGVKVNSNSTLREIHELFGVTCKSKITNNYPHNLWFTTPTYITINDGRKYVQSYYFHWHMPLTVALSPKWDTLAMMKLWRREVVGSSPDRDTIAGRVFSPTFLAKFWIYLQWGSSNHRPSAPFLYEVASYVKNCRFGDYYYITERHACPSWFSLVLDRRYERYYARRHAAILCRCRRSTSHTGQTTANESMFTYEIGASHSTFVDVTFSPQLEPLRADAATLTRVTELCGDSEQCRFDYLMTGNPSLAVASLNAVMLQEAFVTSSRKGRRPRRTSGGRCTSGRIGPTWDNPELRRFYWLLNRMAADNDHVGPPILPLVQQCYRVPELVSWSVLFCLARLHLLTICGQKRLCRFHEHHCDLLALLIY